MWKIILITVYMLIPSLAVFMLGYGGIDKVVSNLFQVFIGSYVLIAIYDAYLLVACLRDVAHKTKPHLLKRLIVVSAILLYIALLAPRFSPWFGRLGAAARLRGSGGDVFCSRLLDDAERLIAEVQSGNTSYFYIERDNLPESFVQLGAMSGQVHAEERAHIVLNTSGRPYRTQWILVPLDSDAAELAQAVRVRPGIYRKY